MRNFVFLFLLIILGISPLLISAQTPETLTNESIIQLIKAGLPAEVIIEKIKTSETKFDTSTEALVELKKAGVPENIILVMISPKKPAATPEKPEKPTRLKDELGTMFSKLKNSVVTVWSEFGHGTGFIIDKEGLILTNFHVVGPTRFVSIQFDESHKVQATILAADSKRDIAVLWANIEPFTNAIPAKIVDTNTLPTVEEGERVLAIGSPLNQQKIMTTGVVSKVEERAIISDVNINHGNSGGPLFNSLGEVIGVNTFGDFTAQGGPGISGIVRIEVALPVISDALKAKEKLEKPSARLLPVEPKGKFPLEAIKEVATAKKFETKPYEYSIDDFDVLLLTPTLQYRIETEAEREAAKTREKRNKKEGAVTGTFRPFENFFGWREYIGDYKPILIIRATPELGESFWGAVGRGVMANYGIQTQAKLRFKTDFYRMRLMCGDKEVEPIHPAKIAHILNESNYLVSVKDATYEGLYSYPADAISPKCGKVSLELYSEKEPNKAKTKVLNEKTVLRITEDFAPYLNSLPK